VQLYRYFVSHRSEFCGHNPLSNECLLLFRYRRSPETFGYTFIAVTTAATATTTYSFSPAIMQTVLPLWFVSTDRHTDRSLLCLYFWKIKGTVCDNLWIWIFEKEFVIFKSRDSSVGIATRLRAGWSGFWGSIPGGDWKFCFKPPHTGRFWGPPSFLSNGYRGLLPWE
jgi:hypothetical protein